MSTTFGSASKDSEDVVIIAKTKVGRSQPQLQKCADLVMHKKVRTLLDEAARVALEQLEQAQYIKEKQGKREQKGRWPFTSCSLNTSKESKGAEKTEDKKEKEDEKLKMKTRKRVAVAATADAD